MSTASFSIFEAPSSNVAQLHFEVTLTSASGAPLPGADVRFRLDGDGSLSPSLNAKEIGRETDTNGRVRATWFRRGIFGRDVKATFTASSDRPGSELSMRQLSSEEARLGPRTGWMPEPKLGS